MHRARFKLVLVLAQFSMFDCVYKKYCSTCTVSLGRLGGMMVNVLDSGSRGTGLSPGRVMDDCVVFLGKTLYSHSASLHPGV